MYVCVCVFVVDEVESWLDFCLPLTFFFKPAVATKLLARGYNKILCVRGYSGSFFHPPPLPRSLFRFMLSST